MNNKKPVLSVITVSYNSEKTITDTLESILSYFGELMDFEVEYIVIDGGSNDKTLKIIQSRKISQLTLISEKDNGIFDAMNKGLKISKGEYVWYLNSDDFINTNSSLNAHALIALLKKYSPDLFMSNIEMFKIQNGKYIVKRIWKDVDKTSSFTKLGWHPPHPAFIAKRSLLIRVGGFDVTKKIAADYKLMMQMLKMNLTISKSNKVLTKMRLGGHSNSGFLVILKSNIEAYISLREIGYSRTFATLTILSKVLFKVTLFI